LCAEEHKPNIGEETDRITRHTDGDKPQEIGSEADG
jgi:hypothetical protein